MQSQVDLHARGIFGDVLHAPTPPTISESAWCSGSDIMQSSLSFDDISELLPGAYEQDDVHELKVPYGLGHLFGCPLPIYFQRIGQ